MNPGGFRVMSENLNYSAQALTQFSSNTLEGQEEMLTHSDNPEKDC